MAVAIMLYSVWASVFTIWCSLQTNLDYVMISDTLLHKWQSERENLIVIDLLPKAKERVDGGALDSLEVSEHELVGLLQWIPPKSMLVVCHVVHMDRFGRRIEEALLRAAIDTVYLLDAREYYLFKADSRRNLYSLAPSVDRRVHN
jgi:hypothetical protein